MATYRLCFRNRRGALQGVHDFEADDDTTAIVMAGLLHETCCDMCDTYELWQGSDLIYAPYNGRRPTIHSAAQLSAALQESLVRSEELMQQSRWAIAKSKRLLERMKAHRRS
jgi:hypothetical protein